MQHPFRVLFLTQLPPPVHGSAVISKMIVESAVIRNQFDIRIIPLHFAKNMRDLGSFSITKLIKMLHVAFTINSAIRRFKPHVVYFTLSPKGFSFYRDILYVSILKFHGSNIVYHLHVKGIDEEGRKSPLKRYLYRFAFANTHIITLSTYLVDELRTFYTGTPFVVNNGVQTVAGAQMLTRNNREARVELLYLSNLMRAKGILVLLESIAGLSENRPDFLLRIVGNPADVSMEELEAFIKTHDLSDVVRLETAKYGKEKNDAFESADIFVHPTLNDAFPLVILEAMQFQLPVVSTFEGAIPEIVVDGVTGHLVPKNNPVALGQKMLHLIQNKEERIRMGSAGRQRFLANYTTESMESNVADVLTQVASKRISKP